MTYNFTAQEVYEARERIKDYVYKTPLEESLYLGDGNRKYFFKLENLQTVKSFKIRGALSKMTTLSDEEKARGVATISSGNHGASVSYAAKLLGIENAKVIVPETTPKSKVDKIKFYGADVLLMGKNYDEAHALGMKFIEENQMTYIDAYYDDYKIYGGQGTIGLEILEQNPEIDTIVVPIGGGGLSTGIAVAAKSIKPEIKIIGVQTEACPAMIKSYEDGVFYDEYPVTGDTLCDSLVGGVGALAYEMQKDLIDEFIEVKESTIRKALKFVIGDEKYIVEGGSATTVAAVLDYPEIVGGNNIALVMSGGNIDKGVMAEVLSE